MGWHHPILLSHTTLHHLAELSNDPVWSRELPIWSSDPPNSYIQFDDLINWLDNDLFESNEDIDVRLEFLCVFLLRDLRISLGLPTQEILEEQESYYSRFLFWYLIVAGTIYFGCEGFDGIATMLATFSLPTVIIVVFGLFFAVVSIILFYGFDFGEIKRNLNISENSERSLLDGYLDEITEIIGIRKRINQIYVINEATPDEQDAYHVMVNVLLKRQQILLNAIHTLRDRNDHFYLKLARFLLTSVVGILFFNAGYFAGETVAMLITSMFIPTVSAAFWPIILFSIVVGFFSFSVFCFVEQPGIVQLVGFDSNQIQCVMDKIEDEGNELVHLKNNLQGNAKLMNTNSQQQERIHCLEQLLEEKQHWSMPTPRFFSAANCQRETSTQEENANATGARLLENRAFFAIS